MKSRPGCLEVGFLAAGAALVLFIVFPLLATLFSTSPDAVRGVLSDPEVQRSFGITFGAAALASGIGMLGGLPLAYLLARRRFPGKRLAEAVIDLPVIIPHTAAGIALLLVFGSRGWAGQALAPVGLVFTDNLAGVVVAMLFVSLPFLVNASREAFALVEVELEQAATVEGATPWQAFYHVTLPIARRGVISGLVMMWSRGISEFGAVVILAYHPKILPVLVFERFGGFGLDAAQPVAALLIVIVFVIFAALRFLVNDEAGG